MYFIGIDLGGTYIKGGICDNDGKIIIKDEISTDSSAGALAVIKKMAELTLKMLEKKGIALSEVSGIGAGIPGMIDSLHGTVIYSNNLKWKNVELAKELGSLTGLPVYISNDANVAALGESTFGVTKDYSDSILITLGTGVGGGVIINNKIFEGNLGAGAELGHMAIKSGGERCTCGRRGCFESYSSATALIRQTKREMAKNPSSKMWEIAGGSLDKVNGKTAFDAYPSDPSAKKVVSFYIKMLAEGLCNLANIFRPQVIVLGGGISKQGEMLTDLIKTQFDKMLFGGKLGPNVELKLASLRNDAGFLGGVALAMEKTAKI